MQQCKLVSADHPLELDHFLPLVIQCNILDCSRGTSYSVSWVKNSESSDSSSCFSFHVVSRFYWLLFYLSRWVNLGFFQSSWVSFMVAEVSRVFHLLSGNYITFPDLALPYYVTSPLSVTYKLITNLPRFEEEEH